MDLVLDASVFVAAVLSTDERGDWARSMVRDHTLFAPELMPAEVANILRRAEVRGAVTASYAAAAFDDLLSMPVELLRFGPLAQRVWQLRHNVTVYDAWYVATAERIEAPLATVDMKLVRASGPTCPFVTPDLSDSVH